jgi:hypothetical protein
MKPGVSTIEASGFLIYNDNNMTKKEEIDDIDVFDDYSEEDELLYSLSMGPRIFNLNNSNGTTMLGVLMEETDDSFLVGLPSRLIQNDGVYKVEPYLPVKFARFFKNSIVSTMFLFDKFYDTYIEYLQTRGKEIFPELVESLEFNEEDLIENFSVEKIKTKLSDEEAEELAKKLEDIVSRGGVIVNGTTTKN